MLAHYGIIFLTLHLLGIVALVLGRGVEVTGAGSRDEFNFLLHDIARYLTRVRRGRVGLSERRRCQPCR